MNIIKCTVCGGQLTEQGNVRRCRFCNTEFEIRNRQMEDELQEANAFRECARFADAEYRYGQILKRYPNEDLSEVYWNLLLCEHKVMFETDEKGERFPSFYAINRASVGRHLHSDLVARQDADEIHSQLA